MQKTETVKKRMDKIIEELAYATESGTDRSALIRELNTLDTALRSSHSQGAIDAAKAVAAMPEFSSIDWAEFVSFDPYAYDGGGAI